MQQEPQPLAGRTNNLPADPHPVPDYYHAAGVCPNLWPLGRGVVLAALSNTHDSLVLRAVPDSDDGTEPVQAWARSEELQGPMLTLNYATVGSLNSMIETLQNLRDRMLAEGPRPQPPEDE